MVTPRYFKHLIFNTDYDTLLSQRLLAIALFVTDSFFITIHKERREDKIVDYFLQTIAFQTQCFIWHLTNITDITFYIQTIIRSLKGFRYSALNYKFSKGLWSWRCYLFLDVAKLKCYYEMKNSMKNGCKMLADVGNWVAINWYSSIFGDSIGDLL